MFLGKIHTSRREMKGRAPDSNRAQRLLDALGRLYRRHESLRSLLRETSQLAVELLGAEHCAIAWLNGNTSGIQELASYNKNAANGFSSRVEQVISSYVQSNGRNGQINTGAEMRNDQPINMAGKSEVVFPLRVNEQIVGYLYARNGDPAVSGFSEADQSLLAALGQHLGFAIETQKMREMLSSRYAAVTLHDHDDDKNVSGEHDALVTHILASVENPERVAKIIARSFYKDLRKAGFETKQILVVASELISNLNEALRKTKARAGEEQV